jgi:hypothetical protein
MADLLLYYPTDGSYQENLPYIIDLPENAPPVFREAPEFRHTFRRYGRSWIFMSEYVSQAALAPLPRKLFLWTIFGT